MHEQQLLSDLSSLRNLFAEALALEGHVHIRVSSYSTALSTDDMLEYSARFGEVVHWRRTSPNQLSVEYDTPDSAKVAAIASRNRTRTLTFEYDNAMRHEPRIRKLVTAYKRRGIMHRFLSKHFERIVRKRFVKK